MPHRLPDITILISTYQRRDVLLDTLGRLQRLQKHVARSIEIIVVDNASADGTADAVATNFADVKLIRLRRNEGACAKNHGLRVAGGELVLLLDDDSYPDARSLQQMCWHFAADASLGAAVFNVELPDGSRECSAYPSVVIGCGSGFRRQALLEVGGLPDDFFMQAEEYDLSLRLLDGGWHIRRFDDLLVQHRKTAAARVPTRTTRLDARNNLLLIARRFPRRHVLPFAIDWMRRYAWIASARGKDHRRAFGVGVLQGLGRAVLTRNRRSPVSDEAFEAFAMLDATERRLKDWAAHTGCRRIVLIDVGKNLLAYQRAADAAGLMIVAIADNKLGGRGLRYHGVRILRDAEALAVRFDGAVVANTSPVHAERRRLEWAILQSRPVVDLIERGGVIAIEGGLSVPRAPGRSSDQAAHARAGRRGFVRCTRCAPREAGVHGRRRHRSRTIVQSGQAASKNRTRGLVASATRFDQVPKHIATNKRSRGRTPRLRQIVQIFNEPATLLRARPDRNLAELLLVPLDQLAQRHRQPLGAGVAHDHPVGDLEQQPGVAALLRVGVGHVEAEVDDHFFGRRMDAVGVREDDLQVALVENHLHALIRRGFFSHVEFLLKM